MSRSQVTRAAGAAALRRDRVVARIAIGITGGAILLAAVVAIRLEAGRVTPSPSEAGVLAVLPFRSTEPDPATSYFGIGLADAILNRVSRVPGLTVRPMSATLALAAELTDPMAAGRALGASAVLAGTYHLTTRRIDIQVTLIDVGTGAVLWRHSLDSAMTDLMQVEQQVVRQTLDVLMPDPMSEPAPAAPVGGERDPAAHYLYILARGKMATLLVEVIPEVVQLLEDAVRKEPDSAPIHAQLSIASTNMFLSGLSTDRAWLERALASARRAVSLDAREPECRLSLAYALMASGDTVGTVRETLEALRLDPDHPEAMRMLAQLLAGAGLTDPVRKLRDGALERDPSLEMGWVNSYLAVAENDIETASAGMREEVDRRRAAGRSPEVPVFNLGYLAFESGDAAQGLHWAAMMETVSASPVYADILRLLALARAGDGGGVDRILQKHGSYFARDWEYSGWIGRALAAVGRSDEAIEWLERSARMGSYQIRALERCDALAPLRGDARMEEVLAIVRGRARDMVQLSAFAGYR